MRINSGSEIWSDSTWKGKPYELRIASSEEEERKERVESTRRK
jgi:hypothetical protein